MPSNRSCVLAPAVLALVLTTVGQATADIIVTADAPGVQSSTVSGVTTMDFNSVAVGSYTSLSSPIGTYTAPSPGLAVVNPDDYGGADQTRYMVVGKQSGELQATLTLTSPAAYFGFYWSAGDAGNTLEFFDKGTLEAAFNVGSIIPLLQTTGGPYGNGHFSNPNNGADGGEPFVYLNFIATGGVVFDQIEFLNASFSTGFESDNHSFRAAPLGAPLPGTPVATIHVQGVPEPASIFLIGLGAVGVAGHGWRKRRAA